MRLTVNCCALAVAAVGLLQGQGAPDDNKLLATFQNPVGDLISVPFQNNVNFPIGEYSRIQDVLNIQPVVPIHVSEDWLIISRWITPVVYQPGLGSACWTSGFAVRVICEFRGTQISTPVLIDSAPQVGANPLPSGSAAASMGQLHSPSTPRRA